MYEGVEEEGKVFIGRPAGAAHYEAGGARKDARDEGPLCGVKDPVEDFFPGRG